jgi:hypothetical protein
MRRALLGAAVALQAGLFVSGSLASAASAHPWAGPDPSSNFAPKFPYSCYSAPTGNKCLKAGQHYLDSARAHLHQAAYKLPHNFLKLAPNLQAFILTNLDRGVYHLPAMAGLTNQLDKNALAGVHADNDPQSGLPGFTSNPNFRDFTSNWAGGYPNILFAYGSWMYDDGLGSHNGDCRKTHTQGCWGHRHDILWKFNYESGRTAMGAAAGKDRSGQRGYAMLLGRGSSQYRPKYLRKWSDHTKWW